MEITICCIVPFVPGFSSIKRVFCMGLPMGAGPGGNTPRHTHEWEHEVFVHKGRGQVMIDNEWHNLSEGSAVFIPANVEHQFRNTDDELFTFVCLVPSGAPEL